MLPCHMPRATFAICACHALRYDADYALYTPFDAPPLRRHYIISRHKYIHIALLLFGLHARFLLADYADATLPLLMLLPYFRRCRRLRRCAAHYDDAARYA